LNPERVILKTEKGEGIMKRIITGNPVQTVAELIAVIVVLVLILVQ
jgi:hypothetical protein